MSRLETEDGPRRDEQKERVISDALADFRFRRFEAREAHPVRRLLFRLRYQFRRHYFAGPPRWRLARRVRTWRDRMAPTFASVGAVRSGTSALAGYLFQHPHVILPLAKEIDGLSVRHVRAHCPTLAEGREHERRFGGALTGYCLPVVPDTLGPFLLRALSPEMRVVLILRDPVERCISHFHWNQQRLRAASLAGDPPWTSIADLANATRLEMRAIRAGGVGFRVPIGKAGIVQASIYAPFVELLFETFSRENVLVVAAEEFFADPQGVAQRVYAFLDLPEHRPSEMEIRNAVGRQGAADGDVREALAAFYRPYNDRLFELLGRDLGWG